MASNFNIGDPSAENDPILYATGYASGGAPLPGVIVRQGSTQYPGLAVRGRIRVPGTGNAITMPAISPTFFTQKDFSKTVDTATGTGWGVSYCFGTSDKLAITVFNQGIPVEYTSSSYCQANLNAMGFSDFSNNSIQYPNNPAMAYGFSSIGKTKLKIVDNIINKTSFNATVNGKQCAVRIPSSLDFNVSNEIGLYCLPSPASFMGNAGQCFFCYVDAVNDKTLELTLSKTNMLAMPNHSFSEFHISENSSNRVSIFTISLEQATAIELASAAGSTDIRMNITQWNKNSPTPVAPNSVIVLCVPNNELKYSVANQTNELCTATVLVNTEMQLINIQYDEIWLFFVEAFSTSSPLPDHYYIAVKAPK